MTLPRSFQQSAFERFIPWTATLELTLRCNLRCVHCYNFDRADEPPDRAELSTAEWLDAVEQLRAAGCHQIVLTGGEATLHPAFVTLLERTAKLGMAASVISNGTALTDGAADRIASFDHVVDVSVSVYGARAETHDAATRVAGSFERTMRGARRLRAAGVPVTLKFVLMDVNIGEAEGMTALAGGFQAEFNPYLHPRHDGDRSSLDRRASHEALESAYRGPLRSTLTRAGDCDALDGLICSCARSNCAISSAGDVFPCISVPMACGNIRERPFARIWSESPQLNRIRRLQPADFAACAPCPLKSCCRRKPGPAFVLTGEFTGVDPWTCADAAAISRTLS